MTVSPLYTIDAASVHRTVLQNGLRVLIKSDFSAPVVAIVTFVSAGYFDETDDSVGIARVLEVIIQEAKRKADNPPAVATETLYELLHDKHRIRRWRIGREPGLRALTRDALLRFYRNFYHPGNTVLSIVGAVDTDDAMQEVERLYGGLHGGTPMRSAGPTEEGTGGFRYREL